jgi:hypothetical protein
VAAATAAAAKDPALSTTTHNDSDQAYADAYKEEPEVAQLI